MKALFALFTIFYTLSSQAAELVSVKGLENGRYSERLYLKSHYYIQKKGTRLEYFPKDTAFSPVIINQCPNSHGECWSLEIKNKSQYLGSTIWQLECQYQTYLHHKLVFKKSYTRTLISKAVTANACKRFSKDYQKDPSRRFYYLFNFYGKKPTVLRLKGN